MGIIGQITVQLLKIADVKFTVDTNNRCEIAGQFGINCLHLDNKINPILGQKRDQRFGFDGVIVIISTNSEPLILASRVAKRGKNCFSGVYKN